MRKTFNSIIFNQIALLLIVIFGGSNYLFSQESNKLYDSLTVFTFRDYKPFNEKIDFNNIDYSLVNAAVFHATNEQRMKKRKSILLYSPLLEQSATYHSNRMVEKDFFNHTDRYSKKSETPTDRAKIAGISNPYIAENIAEISGIRYESGEQVYIADPEEGIFTRKPEGDTIQAHTYLSIAEDVVKRWMNSPGHRKNILSENALQLGCGMRFYRDKRFYQMPMFRATQNFQEYEMIKSE